MKKQKQFCFLYNLIAKLTNGKVLQNLQDQMGYVLCFQKQESETTLETMFKDLKNCSYLCTRKLK